MKVGIVTDSTADLPPAWIDDHGIHVIPAIIIHGEQAYQDGEGMSRDEFYKQLPGMQTVPTTAAPSSGAFQVLYDQVLTRVDQVVSLHLASSLSGIYAAACVAADEFKGRVTVVDSRQISMGLGFQVLAAARAAKEQRELAAVIHAATMARERLHLVAMIDTLEYLKRSGRVSFMKARLGALLRVRLFVGVQDGRVIPLEQARTRAKSIARLGQMLGEVGNLEHLAILHAGAEDDARRFAQEYAPEWASRAPVINVTTVIGTHVGPQAIGFAAIGQV